DAGWTARVRDENARWRAAVDAIVAREALPPDALPGEADVIGAVQRSDPHSASRDVVVCAAGTLPAELHKLWRSAVPGGYHVEYGYSCMGYEIAGALGVKMALPDREVVVMLGDGSYLMMNSEIATSVAMGRKLVIVVLDNRGFGCINRLQQACGSPPFNNLLAPGAPVIDFAAHARALGADAVHVTSIDALEAAMQRARQASKTQVIVIDTDPARTTTIGGAWWEVAVPEVSARAEVRAAHAQHAAAKLLQKA
ncbi:MAG: thiamine pyrophosphate-dependent enzyme, partial [Casimicrobiaceae bacterium]